VDDVLLQAGLVLPRQNGPGHYDRFRGRLIFPIRDVQGRTIAFGGRALGPEEPKYLNSPETSLYVKGQQLYGLDLARAAMRDRGRAIVVEGYLDCLMAHQHGCAETVAALGTAFTPAQLGLLRRHSDEVITVFDADAAGQKAAARAEEMVDELMGIDGMGWSVGQARGFDRPSYYPIRVAVLPAGDDPDSLLRAQGAEAFRSRLDEARSILSFVMAQALAEEDLSTERGRATAHARAALLLSKVSNAEEATTLSRQAARELGVDPTQLWIEARQLQGARARQLRPEPRQVTLSPQAPAGGAPWPSPTLAERDLLALLLQYPEARGELLEHLEEADVAHPGLRELLGAVRRAPERPAEALMSELESEAARGLLASLLIEDRLWTDIPGMIVELRRRYEIRGRKRRLREVAQSIVRAQTESGAVPASLDTAMEALQRQAREVRELTVARATGSTSVAAPPGPGPERSAAHAVPTPPPTETP
jgi:DNA primase